MSYLSSIGMESVLGQSMLSCFQLDAEPGTDPTCMLGIIPIVWNQCNIHVQAI